MLSAPHSCLLLSAVTPSALALRIKHCPFSSNTLAAVSAVVLSVKHSCRLLSAVTPFSSIVPSFVMLRVKHFANLWPLLQLFAALQPTCCCQLSCCAIVLISGPCVALCLVHNILTSVIILSGCLPIAVNINQHWHLNKRFQPFSGLITISLHVLIQRSEPISFLESILHIIHSVRPILPVLPCDRALDL